MKRLRRAFKPMHFFGLAILIALWVTNQRTVPLISEVYPIKVPTFDFIETARLRTFDMYQRIKPREPAQQLAQVRIVDIDDKSLEALGQWPWSRPVIAQLVDKLRENGALVIGFDVFFAETDRTNPTLIAQNMPDLDPTLQDTLNSLPSSESYFAAAMNRHTRVVLGQSVASQPQKRKSEAPSFGSINVKSFLTNQPLRTYLDEYPGFVLRNVEELEETTAGLGMVLVPMERDGVVRRVGLVSAVAGKKQPSLVLEMLRVALGSKGIVLDADEKVTYTNRVIIQSQTANGGSRNFAIPTDDKFRTWVHFRASDLMKKETGESIYVSAIDVLEGTVPPKKMANAFVLVGTSATGLKDLRNTPINAFLPGVEVHAQMLEMMLSDSYLLRPKFLKIYENIAILVIGIIMIILVPLLGAAYTLVFGLLVVGGLMGSSWYAYTELNFLVDGMYPAVTALIMYISLSYMNYAREEAQKKQVRGAFSRYMSPALVEQLADDPSQLKLGGEMRDMSLLFCDIRGFTTISEQFDPEGLTRFINRFLTPMTDVILQRQGTIDKYMGDCIMAFWNAPLIDPNHSANACDSALAMIRACADLNVIVKAEAEAENRKFIEVRIGIGINSDSVCVGNMGSDQRFDYSVLGDGVNLAARLEGQSKTYGVTVVIGEGTVLGAPDFATIELDLIQVKGKTEPVRIFALLGDRELAKDGDFMAYEAEHSAYLQAYRDQKFAEAKAMSERLREPARRYNCEGYYDLIDERIDVFLEAPPEPGWTGVFVATSK